MINKDEIKAHVDLTTGEIHGCKEGTWKWFHERGHLAFNSDPDKSFWIMIVGWIDFIWKFVIMCAIVYNPLVYLGVVLWVIPLYFNIYEESWCNKYADIMMKEVEKNGSVEEDILEE